MKEVNIQVETTLTEINVDVNQGILGPEGVQGIQGIQGIQGPTGHPGNHSELTLDDGTNPHATTKTDVGLSDVPNTDFTTAVGLNTAKVGITPTQASDITTNNAKETNIAHPLVETAVPIGAVFTDTIYDDTVIQAEVDLNTAKVTSKFIDGTDPLDAVYMDGNVGIGVQPTSKLYVLSDTNDTATFEKINGNLTEINTTLNGTYGLRTNEAIKGRNFFFYNSTGAIKTYTGVILFYTSSSAKFGMNTSSSLTSQLTIQGAGSTSLTSALTVRNSISTPLLFIEDGGNTSIGTTNPQAKLDVNGGVKIADDTDVASVDKVGTMRYRTDANNSYMDMCMQVGISSYQWINIKTNTW